MARKTVAMIDKELSELSLKHKEDITRIVTQNDEQIVVIYELLESLKKKAKASYNAYAYLKRYLNLDGVDSKK